MPRVNKWNILPNDLRRKIIDEARTTSAMNASKKYYKFTELSAQMLQRHILMILNPAKWDPVERKKLEKENREFSSEEKEFLEKIERGEMDMDLMRGKVARMAFERVLRNPDQVKFIDFIRTEILNSKQEEIKASKSWGKEIIARLFAGKLPPRNCPNCNYSLVLLGEEVVEDERVADTGEDI